MTPSTEDLLLKEVQPRLRTAVANTIPIVASDDHEELLQDGLVIALHLLNSARRARKNVTAQAWRITRSNACAPAGAALVIAKRIPCIRPHS